MQMVLLTTLFLAVIVDMELEHFWCSKMEKSFTPLMYLTKAETWKLANELDVLEIIRTETHTTARGGTSSDGNTHC